MLKKILFLVVAIMGISIATVSAKTALYSDIDTYINHYPISAYAVDGKMTVVAEDLRDYGFNVIWDEGARALHISRNHEVTQLVRKDVYDPKYASGTKMSDIYFSDIKVDYEGTQLTSYALNGYTMIPINDFAELVGHGEWNGSIRAYKVWVDGLSTCEYKPLKQRCINLWYSTDYSDMPGISIYEDMDSDGIEENIKISMYQQYDSYNISAALSIGDLYIKNILSDVWAYHISAVYLVDLVPNDRAKELVIFTETDNDWQEVQIYRYDRGYVSQIPFKEWDYYENSYSITDCLSVGSSDQYFFDINDDGSIVLRRRTGSCGMWDVYVTYKRDGNMYEQVIQNYYEVAPNSWYGYNQWGYWYVDNTYTGHGIPLYRGDWIKPTYDDMNGSIFIQKSNGTSGWLYDVNFYASDIDEYNARFNASTLFHMAG